jgi:hypothetical protein
VLGRDNTGRLTDTIFDIEKVGEVRALRRMLQRG